MAPMAAADRIQALAGPLTPDTHVFLCGPAAMTKDLIRGLQASGIPREHLHAEYLTFR